MKIEYTQCQFDVKAAEEKGDSVGTITGLGSHFNNVDSGQDVILPGAFEKSLKTKMPIMLWQHDHTQVPGKWTGAKEGKDGLELTGELARKTTLGNDVYELGKMGAVDGLSVGFTIPPGGAEYNDDGVRLIKEINLWEVSIVTFPMNELARVTSVKTRLAKGDTVTARELETILRDAGFSKVDAKTIVARGYGGIADGRDDVRSIIESVKSISEGFRNGS